MTALDIPKAKGYTNVIKVLDDAILKKEHRISSCLYKLELWWWG